jgi:SAM-dependent methyltransferase
MSDAEPPLVERLLALWDHLGLTAPHVAAQMPGDLADLSRLHGDRIGGLVFCVPTRLDPLPFAGLADRTLLISAEHGLSAAVTSRGAERLQGARRVVLQGYDAPGWADVVTDRTDAIVAALSDVLGTIPGDVPGRPIPPAGSHAGISWQAAGRGPALILMPLFLAPSQWEAALPALTRDFTVIRLGGRHIGGIAALEDRARAPSYRGMVQTLFDLMDAKPGETVLDVGCGSGALDRQLARRIGGGITATDLNRFLLSEAERLAEEEGGGAIRFTEANAESLPFPDASFDHAFTVTVLEECDADRALAELVRVVRPGGRVGVIVRAIDMPQWWHLDVPDTIRRKVDVPPQSVGANGVADASLYRRMRTAGLTGLRGFPSLITLDLPDGPIWRYREDHVLTLLDTAETAIWRAAADAARQDGLLFQSHPMHCAVGVRR